MNRRGSLFWGSVLILLAALLLLRQMGFIAGDIFGYFWPLLIIAFGVWMVLGYFLRRKPVEGEQVSIPLEGATEAYIILNHAAGRLTIRSGAGAGELLNGAFGNGLSHTSHINGGRKEVKLRSSQQFWAWWPGESLDWDVHLNPNVPLSLKIDSGASASTIDLSDLKVNALDIDTGASSTELILPANAGNVHVDIDTGASSLKIKVPSDVAASIRIKSGISSINVNSRFARLEGGHYQSPDFATAVNRADITIDTGVGSIDIS